MKILVELGDPSYTDFTKSVVKRAKARPANVFDFTMLSTFMECPAKFYQRHEEHLQSIDFAPAALILGGGLHNSLAYYYNAIAQQRTGLDLKQLADDMKQAFVAECAEPIKANRFPLTQADARDGKRCVFKAFDIIENYINHYGYDMFDEIIDVETPFAIIIPYFDQLSKEEGEIIYVGRRDALVSWNGRLHVLEHKTSSMVTKFYIESWNLDYQVSGYIKAAQELTGKDISRAIVNVLGVYKSDTPRFERIPCSRSPKQLDAFTGQINSITKTILSLRQRVENGEDPYEVFWRAPKACHKWNSRCQFHGLCSAMSSSLRDSLKLSRFETSLWSPYNIHEMPDDGSDGDGEAKKG